MMDDASVAIQRSEHRLEQRVFGEIFAAGRQFADGGGCIVFEVVPTSERQDRFPHEARTAALRHALRKSTRGGELPLPRTAEDALDQDGVAGTDGRYWLD